MQVDVFLNLEGTRHALGRLTDEEGGIAFQYASGFLQSGLEVSPFGMPASGISLETSLKVFRASSPTRFPTPGAAFCWTSTFSGTKGA